MFAVRPLSLCLAKVAVGSTIIVNVLLVAGDAMPLSLFGLSACESPVNCPLTKSSVLIGLQECANPQRIQHQSGRFARNRIWNGTLGLATKAGGGL